VGTQVIYDFIVVGSGAAGGIAAYVLAMKGLRVLCLEAGRMLDPNDFFTHKHPYEWSYRGAGKPGQYSTLLCSLSGWTALNRSNA
jgi:choline dehydrogenase-like flavoprotein